MLRLRRALLTLYDFSLKHPRILLVAAGISLIAGGVGLGRLRTVLKIQDVLDRDSEQAQAMRAVSTDFRVGNTSVLVLAPPLGRETFTTEELCWIRRWLSEWRAYQPALIRSISTFDLRKPVRDSQRLLYPPLLKLECDGTDLPGKVEEAFEELRRSPYANIFVPTRGGTRPQDVLIQLDFENAPETSKLGTFDPAQIQELHETLRTTLLDRYPGMRAHWMGEADYQHFMLEGFGQVGLLNLLLVAFLWLALRAVFGTWRAGACFIGTIVLTAGMLYGAMGWFGAPMDVLTNSLFMMVTVSALEDFVFVAHGMLSENSMEWSAAFRRFILPGFLTSLTTFFGFISLCGVHEQVIPRFGFWAGIGAALEFVVMFLVLPAALQLAPAAGRFCDPARTWFRPRKKGLQEKVLPKKLTWALMLIFPLAVFSSRHLTIFDGPFLLFPAGHPLRQAADYALQTRGWEASLDVVFKDFDQETFNRKVLQELSAIPDVIAIQQPYAVLDYATRGHPPLTQDLIRREFIRSESFKQMVSDNGKARAVLYVSKTDLDTVNRIRKKVSSLCPARECFASGSIVAYSEFTEEIPWTLLQSFLTSLALVMGIIWLVAWSQGAHQSIALFLSALWGPAVMVVLMAGFKFPVNLMTCMFASVLVGLTGDNAIQFLLSEGNLKEGISRRGGASILCTTLMAVSALFFLFSYFGPPRTFGLLLAGGLLAALFGDLWILRALVDSKGRDESPDRGTRA